MLNVTMAAVVGAMKEMLISDDLPPPTPSEKKSVLQTSLPPAQLKSDKLKKLRMTITTKAALTDLLMDTSSPESWVPNGTSQQVTKHG